MITINDRDIYYCSPEVRRKVGVEIIANHNTANLKDISIEDGLELDRETFRLAIEHKETELICVDVFLESLCHKDYLEFLIINQELFEYKKEITLKIIKRNPITEEQYNRINKIVNILEMLKINLALDNFGAENTSIKSFYSLPFARTKINPEFMMDEYYSEFKEEILSGIFYLVRHRKATPILPQIQSENDLTMAMKIGYRYFQGDLLSDSPRIKEFCFTNDFNYSN